MKQSDKVLHDALIKYNLLSPQQLAGYLATAQQKGQSLRDSLLSQEIVSEKQILIVLSQSLHLETVDLKKIREAFAVLRARYEVLVVEGCGGLLVPIHASLYVIDLIKMFHAEVVLVSRSGLGAINHSLLSLEALRARRAKIKGVIFNRLKPGALQTAEKTNPSVVARFGRVPSLGTFPYLDSIEPHRAGQIFLKTIDFKKFLC